MEQFERENEEVMEMVNRHHRETVAAARKEAMAEQWQDDSAGKRVEDTVSVAVGLLAISLVLGGWYAFQKRAYMLALMLVMAGMAIYLAQSGWRLWAAWRM